MDDNVQSKRQSPHHLGIDIPHPKTASNHWYQFYNLINQTIYNLHCPARRCRLVAPTDVHKPVIDLFLQPNAGLSSFPVKILFTFVQLISPANLSTKTLFTQHRQCYNTKQHGKIWYILKAKATSEWVKYRRNCDQRITRSHQSQSIYTCFVIRNKETN